MVDKLIGFHLQRIHTHQWWFRVYNPVIGKKVQFFVGNPFSGKWEWLLTSAWVRSPLMYWAWPNLVIGQGLAWLGVIIGLSKVPWEVRVVTCNRILGTLWGGGWGALPLQQICLKQDLAERGFGFPQSSCTKIMPGEAKANLKMRAGSLGLLNDGGRFAFQKQNPFLSGIGRAAAGCLISI